MVFNILSLELNDETINKFEGLCEEIVQLAKFVNKIYLFKLLLVL